MIYIGWYKQHPKVQVEADSTWKAGNLIAEHYNKLFKLTVDPMAIHIEPYKSNAEPVPARQDSVDKLFDEILDELGGSDAWNLIDLDWQAD